MKDLQNPQLLQNISMLLENARKKVEVVVNQTIVLTYFEIGRMIVEDEQNGENRAEYGENVLKDLASHLTHKFGKGFSETNLRQMRNFHLAYSNANQQTLSADLQNRISQTLSAEMQMEVNQSFIAKIAKKNFHFKLVSLFEINENKRS